MPNNTLDKLKSVDAVDNYLRKMPLSLSELGKFQAKDEKTPQLKTPTGVELSKLEQETMQAADQTFRDAYQPDANFDEQMRNYSRYLHNLDQSLKDADSPQYAEIYLNDLQGELRRTLNAAHEEAYNKIEALFDDEAFVNTLHDMDIEDRDTFKQDTLTSLKAYQAEAQAALHKALEDDITRLHRSNRQKNDERALIDEICKYSKENRAQIQTLAQQAGQNQQTALDDNDDASQFNGVNLKDIESFTCKGRTITKSDKNTYQFSTSFFDNLIGSGSFGRDIQDLVSNRPEQLKVMAKALKAQGYQSIETRISLPANPEREKILMKQAYIAAVEAGFSMGQTTPKEGSKEEPKPYIQIFNHNNQLAKPEELFDSAEYAKLQQLAQQIKEQQERPKNRPKARSIREFKHQIEDLHQSQNSNSAGPALLQAAEGRHVQAPGR
ncbi:MAG TPA: hypothetical protein DEO98_06375 [Legionellales bacterium]|nr:hypothetical protein [Legionellales bacterium]|tara:strand:+ start:422 stop:1738 length:1317 start_codon:yes stop_codon:yes gene_type:complete